MKHLLLILSSFLILHLPRFARPLGSIGFALMLAVSASHRLSFSAQPNILVILVDDMGFSDLGCYGREIPTPNLDALASGGVRFTQFYNTARCSTTRAALMTGLYPHQAGMGACARADIPG